MTTPSSVEPITGTPGSDKIFAESARRGERNANRIADITAANELEAKTIFRLEELIRHGGTTDIKVRRDGIEYHFQADWLNRLFRADNI